MDSPRERKWLWGFLRAYVDGYDVAAARAELPPACFDASQGSGVVRARQAIRRLMRSSGLRYGMPLDPSGRWSKDRPPAEALFLVALARELDLCVAAGLVFGREPEAGPLLRDLLSFLAALLGDDSAAERISTEEDQGRLEREAGSVGRRLWRRGQALVADPVLGLPLHNGLLYSDARFLARLAVDTYRRGRFSAEGARRLRRLVDRQRAALAEALLLMASAENAPSPVARRVILRQLDAVGLPRDLMKQLRAALETPPAPEVLAAALPGRRTRLFVLEQVVLGALADGWRSPRERRFLQRLAETLGIPPEELGAIEAELAEFYAEHPEFVDRFQVRDRLADLSDQVMASVEELVDRNRSFFLHELRQGRELTAALGTLARGGKLDAAQRRRLREQLLDLAKTVPGLALVAAPGGLLLAMALAKILPPSFLPSGFVEGARKPEAPDELTPAEASPAEPRAASGPRRS
ncbi:MAG TPA: TerB family tellurite resistance protein [Myxococcales bacterium]|nr:TerB family tellurite resistance protein [Myxococcales bacterium]